MWKGLYQLKFADDNGTGSKPAAPASSSDFAPIHIKGDNPTTVNLNTEKATVTPGGFGGWLLRREQDVAGIDKSIGHAISGFQNSNVMKGPMGAFGVAGVAGPAVNAVLGGAAKIFNGSSSVLSNMAKRQVADRMSSAASNFVNSAGMDSGQTAQMQGFLNKNFSAPQIAQNMTYDPNTGSYTFNGQGLWNKAIAQEPALKGQSAGDVVINAVKGDNMNSPISQDARNLVVAQVRNNPIASAEIVKKIIDRRFPGAAPFYDNQSPANRIKLMQAAIPKTGVVDTGAGVKTMWDNPGMLWDGVKGEMSAHPIATALIGAGGLATIAAVITHMLSSGNNGGNVVNNYYNGASPQGSQNNGTQLPQFQLQQ